MKTLRRIVAATLFSLAVAVLVLQTACNTVQGVGKDIESAGDAIQKAAD